MILVAAAFAGTYTDDFSTDEGAWVGGTVSDGVLSVTDESATWPVAPAAFSLTARVRLATEGALWFGSTPGKLGVEIAPERGAVTFAGEAMPLPMSHLGWVPDADPVLEPGADAWEAGHVLHCEVARDDDGSWLLYYTGAMSPGYGYRQIGVATSPDGVSWTRYASNPVLTIDYSADVDGVHVHMPSVVRDGADWHMYYACYQNNVGNRICHATSDDGLAWTPQGVALDKGATGEFDAGSLRMPDVWIDGAGLWHLWYDGTDPDQHYGPTGYATSPDGWTWTKQGQILAKTDALQGLSVVESPYGLEAFYNIDDTLGHATADPADPAIWLETGVVLEKGWAWWNDGYLQAPSVLRDDVTWRMWFNAYTYTDATERLGTAHTEPSPGEWLDVAFTWDGATLAMTVDGATRTMDAANLGDLELTATGTAELDDLVIEWTDPEIVDTGAPEDTGGDTAPEDTDDTAEDGAPPEDSDADEVIGEADGCGCGSGVGVGAAWALAACLATRRRR